VWYGNWGAYVAPKHCSVRLIVMDLYCTAHGRSGASSNIGGIWWVGCRIGRSVVLEVWVIEVC